MAPWPVSRTPDIGPPSEIGVGVPVPVNARVEFADINGDHKADALRIGHTGVVYAWLNKLPVAHPTP